MYSIDEFQYAHAAWLVSQGHVPYLDFFDHHFPFLYQLIAPIFLIGEAEPIDVRLLRVFMFVALMVSLGLLAYLNKQFGWAAVLAPALFVAVRPMLSMAVEIRPDALALAFYLGSLALLVSPGNRTKWRAAAAGLLFAATLWTTLKTVYFGLPLLVAWGVDVVVKRRSAGRPITLQPWWFAGGAGVGVAAVLTYLLASGSLQAFWEWCVEWAFVHQEIYPIRKSFWEYAWFQTLYTSYGWMYALALVGVVNTLRQAWRERATEGLQLVFVGSLCAASGLIVMQRAAFAYNGIVWTAWVSLFAARGICQLADLLPLGGWPALGRRLIPAAAVLGCSVLACSQTQAVLKDHPIDYQNKVLREIAALTTPDDCIYDNSGSYVARDHAYFFFYTDRLLRAHRKGMLTMQAPLAITSNQCPLLFVDRRKHRLPDALQDWLDSHFVPYSGELHFWGQGIAPGQQKFVAIKDGHYFIPKAVQLGENGVSIDGAPLDSHVFFLKRGPHLVESRLAGNFRIIWLPANGQPVVPSGAPQQISVWVAGRGDVAACASRGR